MRARGWLIVASVVLLAFAPAPLPKRDRQRENLTDVAGTWTFILWEYNGKREKELEQAYQVEMTKEKFALVMENVRGGDSAFVMRLDPSFSPPAFTWQTGDRVKFVGSYRLQQDHLILIFGPGENLAGRPTDFGGSSTYRFVLRRIKR